MEHLAQRNNNDRAQILADALDSATSKFLENNKSPARKLGQIDNRGSHFYLGMYWAEALAAQSKDKALAERFGKLAKLLNENEAKIVEELNSVHGHPVEIGGYFQPNPELVDKAMRPSATLNSTLASL